MQGKRALHLVAWYVSAEALREGCNHSDLSFSGAPGDPPRTPETKACEELRGCCEAISHSAFLPPLGGRGEAVVRPRLTATAPW